MMPTNDDPMTELVLSDADATARLFAALNADPEIVIRASFMFCQVCERNFREVLVTFEDSSIFTLCGHCVADLREVVQIFDLECSITRF